MSRKSPIQPSAPPFSQHQSWFPDRHNPREVWVLPVCRVSYTAWWFDGRTPSRSGANRMYSYSLAAAAAAALVDVGVVECVPSVDMTFKIALVASLRIDTAINSLARGSHVTALSPGNPCVSRSADFWSDAGASLRSSYCALQTAAAHINYVHTDACSFCDDCAPDRVVVVWCCCRLDGCGE